MSYTNSTTNYGLPQYISTDIPSYLVDQNGAWATIDSALKSASDNATKAINDASTADGKAVTAQTDASSALTKANGALSNIADIFDSTSTYSVGDRVIYNAILYVCSTAVTIPGAFDPVNWTRETIEEEIDDIKSDISTINSNLTVLGDEITIPYVTNTALIDIQNIDISKAGYTPIAFILSNTGSYDAYFVACNITGNTMELAFKISQITSQTVIAKGKVVYKKS